MASSNPGGELAGSSGMSGNQGKRSRREHYKQWMRAPDTKAKIPRQTASNWRTSLAHDPVHVPFVPDQLSDHESHDDIDEHVYDHDDVRDDDDNSTIEDLQQDNIYNDDTVDMVDHDHDDVNYVHGPGDDDFDGLDMLEELATDEDDHVNDTDAGINEPTTGTDPHDPGDKPLYSGARITLATSLLLILTFVTRHGLSGAALVDLLALVEIHCLSDNLCRTSLRLFRKYFEMKTSTPMEKHYCCNPCSEYLGIDKETCHKCGEAATFFITTPLTAVLRTFFRRPDFISHLRYPQQRTKHHPDNIEDVFDGKLYSERFDQDGFLKGTSDDAKKREVHLSFQLNTDGVALFKSSKSSLWPIFLVINELHPKIRFSREYRILCGMWFGSKPNFKMFLQPFAKMFTDLYRTGVEVELSDGTCKTVRGVLLSAVFDSPARCIFQNFIQFNGKHGCPYCVAPGRSVKTSETGTTQTYPYNIEEENVTGHDKDRTHAETLRHAATADKGSPVLGVKGTSPFLSVPTFDIIRCVVPDYMHGVCLGIAKLFISLWFDVSNRSERYSIRKHIKMVDNRLMSIKPPNILTRVPQKIETNIKWWKASEYKNFLLYYSIPCLYGILPDEYFEHLLMLVNAMHILLSNSISRTELKKARLMLKCFCYEIDNLYKSRYCTWNMHSLLHYCKAVEDLGPLFLCSCFWYEDFNGDLRKLFHGTVGIETQILTSLAINQQIPILASKLIYGSLELDLYTHMKNKCRYSRIKLNECISEGIYVVGALVQSNKYTEYIQLYLGQPPKVQETFKRILISGEVVQSKQYDVVKKRNSFTVSFLNGDSVVRYGQVLLYVKCYEKCPNPVFCCVSCKCRSPIYMAVVAELKQISDFKYCSTEKHKKSKKDKSIVNSLALKHVVPVKRDPHCVYAIPVSRIISLCVWMDVGTENAFLGIVPNHFEKD